MRKHNEPIIKDLKSKESILLKKCGILIQAIIIFGSVARDQDTQTSDIDVCVVLKKRDRSKERIIYDYFLDLGKKHNRVFQVIICDEKFTDVERQFLESILREGAVIIGDVPPIPIQKLKLEPYAVIRYNMSKLAPSDKMRLNRLLYGKKTKKIYKGRTYVSQKKGLLVELKGMRAGKSSVLLPEKKSWILEEKLSAIGIKTKKICAWIQKI